MKFDRWRSGSVMATEVKVKVKVKDIVNLR
jgi:hypothetical protein